MHSTLRLAKYFDTKLMYPLMRSHFSTAHATAQKNFMNFKKEYDVHVKEFQQKLLDLEVSNKKKMSKPIASQYTHAFSSKHHPLNFSPVKTAEFFHDFVGPEQVSPHYENFMVARKFLIGFWIGFMALNLGVATVDLHWIAKSSLIPFLFWMQIMYFYIEGRKSFLKPLLVRFYRRAAANEMHTLETFYHENIENKLRELLRITKGQLDYWDIHNNFREVKAESINNFLANEYINLQRNITDRAQNILKQAKTFEEQNKDKVLQKIIDDAISQLDKGLEGASSDVQSKMLDSAIDGLSKGYMEYANDPLLPLVVESIQKNVEKVKNLSEEDQAKLVALSADQIRLIKEADQSAKKAFMTSEPKGIDGSLKGNEAVRRMLETWGSA